MANNDYIHKYSLMFAICFVDTHGESCKASCVLCNKENWTSSAIKLQLQPKMMSMMILEGVCIDISIV